MATRHCPACGGDVTQARTALGPMYRCEPCQTDWFAQRIEATPPPVTAAPLAALIEDWRKRGARELARSSAAQVKSNKMAAEAKGDQLLYCADELAAALRAWESGEREG